MTTRLNLTERQRKTVARIIERHTGWTVGWWVDDDEKASMYAKAAKAVARYIARLKP